MARELLSVVHPKDVGLRAARNYSLEFDFLSDARHHVRERLSHDGLLVLLDSC